MSREKIKAALTDEEEQHVHDYFANNFDNVTHKKVYHCMFKFDLHTGLRIGALTSLDIGDVWTGNKVHDTVTIEPEHQKGNKQQTIPLNNSASDVVKELIKYYKENDLSIRLDKPLFRSRQKNSEGERRVSPRSFQNKLKEINDALQEQGKLSTDLYPHQIRRTFLTRVFKKTGDIMLVKDLANHSDVSTTQQYLSNTREELQEAVNKLDDL